MAIRFSISQDTSLNHLTSSQATKQENIKPVTFQQACARETRTSENLFNDSDFQKQSNCSCTNIRVMQLFHEMKQEFPTVPDHIVNQHVVDNCHDRENCKILLQSEINCHLVPLQTYPAHLLRILNKKSMCKKRLQPKCAVPSIDTKHCGNISNKQNSLESNCKQFLFNDADSSAKDIISNLAEGAQSKAPYIKDMRSGLCNIQIKAYLVDQNKFVDVLNKEKETHLPVVPQRPSTLRLNQEQYLGEEWFRKNKRELTNQQTDKRKSSPHSNSHSQSHGSTNPPSTTSSHKHGTNCNTSSTIQSPTNYTDSRKAEISVNVSLSPSSYHNRVGQPQRHQSTIYLRPELPYTRNVESLGINKKGYTSVNLVLRQPSSSPQSPINITVGPNLTYSSSSYDAQLGYQNNYHITVTDEGGVFSAFRIHPISYYNPTVQYADKDDNKEANTDLHAESTNNSTSQISVAKASNLIGQSDVCKTIMRQHHQMEKLSAVLNKNKNKLGLVRREVQYVMHSVSTDGLSERLDSEIQKLRTDCQLMLNEIENSRTYGISEDGIANTNSIKSKQQQSFPKQKPLRLQPPSISASGLQNHQRAFPIAVVSPRQQSITYFDDYPADFGVGD